MGNDTKGKTTKKNGYFIYHGFMMILGMSILLNIAANAFDTDGYFILNEGRYILHHGIPYENTFSVVKGLKIIEQQWLWSVIVYGFYAVLGRFGLFLISAMHAVVFFTLAKYIAKKRNVDSTLATIVTELMLVLMYGFMSVRPAYVTVNLLLLQIIFLEKYIEKHRWQYLLSMIPISVLEVNLHASMWLMHLAIVLAYIFPIFKIDFFPGLEHGKKLIEKVRYPMLPILISTGLFLISGLVNPYGIDGPLYLIKSMTNDLFALGIDEMEKLAILDSIASITFFMLFAAFLTSLRMGKKQINARFVYIFLGTFLLGCYTYKNVVITSIGIFLMLVNIYQDTDYTAFHTRFHDGFTRLKVPVILLCLIVILAELVQVSEHIWRPTQDTEPTPVNAVRYLERKQVDKDTTRIFTEYNNGAFLGFYGYHGYIDARAEIWYKSINGKKDIAVEWKRLRSSMTYQEFLQFQNTYDFDYFLVRTETRLSCFLEMDQNFMPVVAGEDYMLYRVER